MDPGIDLTLARSNRYVSSEISETMQEWNSCDAGGANLLGVPCLLEKFYFIFLIICDVRVGDS